MSTNINIYKYPRTQHIEGSGIQRGDEDLALIPLQEFAGHYLVVEEKMDGANAAISFDSQGRLLLQSRGHFLNGGPREKQFHLFKTWASRYTFELWDVLGERYVLYGEWLYAKHTVFYTDLPHYFMEFDVLDKPTGRFLSTQRRQELLRPLPFVVSVKVLYTGTIQTLQDLTALIGHSHFINEEHLDILQANCRSRGLDVQRVLKETDTSPLMEGLYIKVEEQGEVKERYKYVRSSFLQTISDSESHWLDRPILPNRLRPGVELF
ncbi:DNA ligase III [Ktedonobacter sp. SOSP1-85]|uniref:RNA ligase family protein n=1 Tax=Ktedonobacter sp. SOSP1-85 TaxID=2778367 RepID=UPI001914D9C0|nr:RNA ligase family protein [Ktedonobacter sp. SOSP1-85]GHO75988.1 DNA ligase III [Ktedonobacter sp. SOSP1-85]